MDGLRRTVATCSDDRSIRVWDLQTQRQLYDFATPIDVPTVVTCHPMLEVRLFILIFEWLFYCCSSKQTFSNGVLF